MPRLSAAVRLIPVPSAYPPEGTGPVGEASVSIERTPYPPGSGRGVLSGAAPGFFIGYAKGELPISRAAAEDAALLSALSIMLIVLSNSSIASSIFSRDFDRFL